MNSYLNASDKVRLWALLKEELSVSMRIEEVYRIVHPQPPQLFKF